MATIEKRTDSAGKLQYRVKVRLRGFPARTATFARLTDAKRWATDTESDLRNRRHFHRDEEAKHTVAELLDRYEADIVPGLKSGAGRKQHLAWWKKTLGEYRLIDFTPPLIAAERDRLLRGKTNRGTRRAPGTVARYLATLSHVCSIAVREYGWLGDNPVKKVRRPSEPRGRVRFLDDDERGRLLTACRKSDSPYLYTVVLVAISTGMRSGEIMGLRWPDVDLRGGRVVLHDTKTGERRTVPLAGPALEQFRKHAKVRRMDTELVFPSIKGNRPMDVRDGFQQALKRAEVTDFRFHDLRHSAASYLAMNGASLAEIAEILGHKTLQMVKRYAHLSEPHTASVVARMNAQIFSGPST